MRHAGRTPRGLLMVVVLLSCAAALGGACSGEDGARTDSTASAGAVSASPSSETAAPIVQAPSPAPTAPPAPPPAPPPTLTLVGHTDLDGSGFNGNVRALGEFAYVGSWGGGRCPALGVRVVDLSDAADPRVVATAARFPGTSAEDVVPLHVTTPAFTGDLLAVGIQRCLSTSGAPGGLALVDVTDATNPVDLGFFSTGRGPRGVHELDVTVQGDRVLALLAVPYSESAGVGDFRIVDITDPRRPVQLSTWGAGAQFGIRDGQGCIHAVYDHSARASADGSRAFLAYWDAGVIILDISDPTAPRFLGRASEPDAEGAIHSIDQTPGGLLLVTEEDDVFRSPRGLRLRVEGGGQAFDLAGCEADSSVELDDTGVLSGGLTYLGNGCAAGGLAGLVALVESGGCGLAAKARRARAAGASALIVIQEGDAIKPQPGDGDPAMPVVGVSAADGERLREMARADDAYVTLPTARPWGGLRIWDISDPAHPVRRAIFRTDNAVAFPPPGPGYYTIHNPLSVGRFALLSWYADGVRLVDLADPAHPREVASFVPPATRDPQGFFPAAPTIWGVALEDGLVLASDINSGLWVLRATGLPAVR